MALIEKKFNFISKKKMLWVYLFMGHTDFVYILFVCNT